MEISAITADRLGNESLQSSFSSKTNLIISPSNTTTATTTTTTSSRNFDTNMDQQIHQQQQQQQQLHQQQQLPPPDNLGDLKSIAQAGGNNKSQPVSSEDLNNFCNNNNRSNGNDEIGGHGDSSGSSQHDDRRDAQLKADVQMTLDSILSHLDEEPYPVVTATTSQSLIQDSNRKVSIISPVKDEDLSKSNDIVMLRNLEITPPPHATPSPNLTKDTDDTATARSTAKKRPASQRTQSEQSDESSSVTGRSKRLRKQTELFQAQSDKKPSTNNSARKKRHDPPPPRPPSPPVPKPQIRLEEPQFQDVIFYEKGDHLAIRNEENTFYLCQLTENVRKQKPYVKIRWLDSADNKTYHLTSHYDQVPQKSIIMPVNLNKLSADKKKRQTFTIDDQIRTAIMDRLSRSLNLPADE